jgi:hypothetical protein
MSTIAHRRTARLAATVVLVVLVSSGCGGGSKTGSTQPNATQPNATQANATQANATQANGLEKRSAAQVEQAAAAALKGAESVHMTGAALNQDKPVQVDLRIQGNASTGTLQLQGGKLQITTIGNITYLKADQQTWEALGAPTVASQHLADRWVKTRPGQVTGLTGFTLENLAAQLTRNDSPLEPQVRQTTLDGKKVVVISRKDGSKLYVANTGLPYPLRAEKQGVDAGRVDLTEYGADFHITAPSNAMDLGKLG